jgi:hypothetical protein
MANEDQQNDSVGIALEKETNQVNEVNFVNRVESVSYCEGDSWNDIAGGQKRERVRTNSARSTSFLLRQSSIMRST